MITATATTAAKATEVATLQARISSSKGANGWQAANDCVDAIFNNGGKIVLPTVTKASTTGATYIAEDIMHIYAMIQLKGQNKGGILSNESICL